MAQTETMDFFAHQDAAKRRTGLLVFYYAAAVVLIILVVNAVVALAFIGVRAKTGGEVELQRLWQPELFLFVTAATAVLVAGGTAFKVLQLREGGSAIARMLGGRAVSAATHDPEERKLLNVVEEMALASGAPVPAVYVLDGEPGINAFAAGFEGDDAVIAVTRGCLHSLSRDELQGVIAHEFSHIFNGDMRLNLRLLGVVHGILVIAIAGYMILRLGFGTRTGSSRKGNGAPLAVLGLVLMIVGYIGVLFGRLIKSAVSRQREFLADASAVQFTRNPDGLAGALKRIGGFPKGSRIQSAHAEEASHFFFCDGLKRGLFSLMATHPPLDERIRRIDPSFAGRAAEPADSPPAAPGAAGLAAAPAAVSAAVGAPRREHLSRARQILSRVPAPLREAVHESFGARAVLYAVLLQGDGDVRRGQLDRLRASADPAVFAETQRLLPMVEALGPGGRLPLTDLALPAMKEMSPAQYAVFRENVDALVRADEQVDLFEFCLRRMLIRHLDPFFGKPPPRRIGGKPLAALAGACADLLSCLAYWGADCEDDARSAFAVGSAQLAPAPVPSIRPLDRCGLPAVDASLTALAGLVPTAKRQVVEACAACVAADGRATVEEAELLRAVADGLGCPVPPLLPDAAA